jgi:VanZ family protein
MHKLFLQLLRLMPYIFWALIAIVTVLMLIELAPKKGSWPYWDKLQHALVFIILTVAGCLAFTQKKLWVCISLVGFGALIEVLQGVVTTTRTPSFYDWLADILGILIALALLATFKKRSAQK